MPWIFFEEIVVSPGLVLDADRKFIEQAPELEERRDASNLAAVAPLVSCDCFVREAVQFALRDVTFDLAIPDLRVEGGEPLAELRELAWRELFDFFLQFFDFRHALVTNDFTTSRHQQK